MKINIIIFLFFLALISDSYAQKNIDYFIKKAKENSLLINEYQNQSKIAAFDFEQIKRALSLPEINLDGNIVIAPIISHNNNSKSFQLVSKDADNYSGYDLAFTDGGQYQAGISVTQSLFKKSLLKAYSDETDALKEINANQIELTKHQLEQLVNYQYIVCLKSKKQAQNTQEILKQLNEQLELMKKLVVNAIYKQSDLILLQIAYQNYQIEYKTYNSNYEVNIYDLYQICGINDTAITDIQEVNFELKPDAVDNSKFMIEYQLDSLQLVSELNLYNQNYKPQVSAFANAGMNAIYLPAFNRFGFSTGLTFNWKLYDGHQQKIQEQKHQVELNTIDFKKHDFITQQQVQKAKLSKQLLAYETKEKMLEAQVKQYHSLIKIYQSELATNQISIMDLKNLITEMESKKQDIVLLKMEKQLLINSYNYWNF